MSWAPHSVTNHWLYPSMRREELQPDSIAGRAINLHGVALRKELAKMRVGVLRRVSSELLPLHKDMSAGLSSKLLASTAGLTMDKVMPDACGRA